jgi:antitoxin component of RelBE/YafQ-DinJ toxin-antitoxin module
MEQFQYGDIRIVVRRATVRVELHAEAIAQKAQRGYSEKTWGVWQTFGTLTASVEKYQGLPFDPTLLHEQDDKEVQAAYEWFLEQDKEFKAKWVEAVNKTNATSGKAAKIETVKDISDLNW